MKRKKYRLGRNLTQAMRNNLRDQEFCVMSLNALLEENKEYIVGRVLRDILKGRDIPVTEIERETGLSRFRIKKVLSLTKSPRIDDLEIVLNYLGFKMDMRIAEIKKESDE